MNNIKKRNYITLVIIAVLLLNTCIPLTVSAKEAAKNGADSVYITTKNVITGKETIREITPSPTTKSVGDISIPGYHGSLSDTPETRTVFPPDDRKILSHASRVNYPTRCVCLLTMYFPNGTYGGTGFLIGPETIVTCGHCVYDPKKGGWANSIRAQPARGGSDIPFGTWATDSTCFTTYTEWTKNQDFKFDLAVIKLVTPSGRETLGEQIGWFGTRIQATYDTTTNYFVTGYASDLGSGINMLKGMGKLAGYTDYLIYHKIDMYNGESGAPVYRVYPDEFAQWQVIGVNSFQNDVRNGAVRLTPTDIDFIYDTFEWPIIVEVDPEHP